MIRGGVILVTALFSVLFLKKKLYSHHYLGCIAVTVGIGLVGASNFIFPANDGAETKVWALILLFVSLLFNGVFYVSEEKIFQIYHMDPLEVVGTEGCWGLILYAIALPILSTMTCTLSGGVCVVYEGKSTFESPALYFHQIANSAGLAVLVIAGIFTIAVFNVAGVNVTKHISSLARSIIDVTRTVLVWLIALIVTFSTSNPHFQWENTRVSAIMLELLGFLVLVVGNLIYNEIIVVPFAKPPPKDVEVDRAYSLQAKLKDNDTVDSD